MQQAKPLPQQTVEACKKGGFRAARRGRRLEVGYPARQPAPGGGTARHPQRAGAVCEPAACQNFEPLKSASPIKDSIIGDQLDILVCAS